SLLATIPGWDPDADPRLEWGDADHLRGELAAYAEGVAVSAHEVHVDAVDAQAAAALAERALPPMAAALAGYPGADANGLRAHAARLLGDAPDGRFLVAVACARASGPPQEPATTYPGAHAVRVRHLSAKPGR